MELLFAHNQFTPSFASSSQDTNNVNHQFSVTGSAQICKASWLFRTFDTGGEPS